MKIKIYHTLSHILLRARVASFVFFTLLLSFSPLLWAVAGSAQGSESDDQTDFPKEKKFEDWSSLDDMDGKVLAATFIQDSIWARRGMMSGGSIEDYAACVGRLPLSEQQKKEFIEELSKDSLVEIVDVQDLREYVTFSMLEYWGKPGKALASLTSEQASLHRVRLLLKVGKLAEAKSEAVRFYKSEESEIRVLPWRQRDNLPLYEYTRPYIAVGDYQGMREYLEVLALAAVTVADKLEVLYGQLDLAYHSGDLVAYALKLKDENPAYFLTYLYRVGRYSEALEMLKKRMDGAGWTPEEVVILASNFKQFKVFKKPIRDMIASGDGTGLLRKELLEILGRSRDGLLSYLPFWQQTHPEELNRWASLYCYRLLPTSGSEVDHRVGDILGEVYQEFPNNPDIAFCLAKVSILTPGPHSSSVDRILADLIREHVRSVDLKKWRFLDLKLGANYIVHDPLYLSDPAGMALGILRSRADWLDAHLLLKLLDESPAFQKLPDLQQARYYALARLDRPFLETMIDLDWSRPENAYSCLWIDRYFMTDSNKMDIPVDLLDRLMDKLGSIVEADGESKAQSDDMRVRNFHRIFNLVISKHPSPEILKPRLLEMWNALGKDEADSAYLVVMQKVLRHYPMIEGVVPKSVAPLQARETGMSSRSLGFRLRFVLGMFTPPDIKRVKMNGMNFSRRPYVQYFFRMKGENQSLNSLQYLSRRVVLFMQSHLMRKPSKFLEVIREGYKESPQMTEFYDLQKLLSESKGDFSVVYSFIEKDLPNEPDFVLFKASLQLGNGSPSDEMLKTLKLIQNAPVMYRERAIRMVRTHREFKRMSAKDQASSERRISFIKSIEQIMGIEEVTGLIGGEGHLKNRMASDQSELNQFSRDKKLDTKECQDLLRKILWDYLKGGSNKALSVHTQAVDLMVKAGTFDGFLANAETYFDQEKTSELDRLLKIRPLWKQAYRRDTMKSVKLNQRIQELKPSDLDAADVLFKYYKKTGDSEKVMENLAVIIKYRKDGLSRIFSYGGDPLGPAFKSAQVRELITLMKESKDRKKLFESSRFFQVITNLDKKDHQATVDFIHWLAKNHTMDLQTKTLSLFLKMNLRDLVVGIIDQQLFLASGVGRASADVLRFAPLGKSVRSGYIGGGDEVFPLIAKAQLAGEVLKVHGVALENETMPHLRNRFLLEMLKAPNLATFDRINPNTLSKLSSKSRTQSWYSLLQLLQYVPDSEALKLYVMMKTFDVKKPRSYSELAGYFKAAYLAGDPEAVDKIWKNLDELLQKTQQKDNKSDIFNSRDEHCLLATLCYGSPTRWQQLMSIYAKEDRYAEGNYQKYFHTAILSKILKVLDLPVDRDLADRYRELFTLAVKTIPKMNSFSSGQNNWTHWVLLSERFHNSEASDYFFEKAKEDILSRKHSSSDALDELIYWRLYLRGEKSSFFPVVHAVREGEKWTGLWSLSGFPFLKSRFNRPAQIVDQDTSDRKSDFELTFLAGMTADRLEVVKVLSGAGWVGSVTLDLPEDSKWLGLMVKDGSGKMIRWATPIKLLEADASSVLLRDRIKAGESENDHDKRHAAMIREIEVMDAVGPFRHAQSLKIKIQKRENEKDALKLFRMDWKPGNSLFVSAWVKKLNGYSISPAVAFYDAEDKWLGMTGLQIDTYRSSTSLGAAGVPAQWDYVATPSGSRLTIPPQADHAYLVVPLQYRAGTLEFADLRIQIQSPDQNISRMRRLGRVPGDVVYVKSSGDDSQIIVVKKDGEVYVFDRKSKGHHLVFTMPQKTKVRWSALRGEVLYMLDDKNTFRAIHLKTKAETFSVSLKDVSRYVREIDLSPDGQWFALNGENGIPRFYQVKKDGLSFVGEISSPEGSSSFRVRLLSFNAASELILVTSSKYWKFHPKTQKLEFLVDKKHGVGVSDYIQHLEVFDRPLAVSGCWLDPKRKQQVRIQSRSDLGRSVDFGSGSPRNHIRVPQLIRTSTLLPQSGNVLLVDRFGTLWEIEQSDKK